MIQSANEISENCLLDADICIVGAGAAGISMALELSGHGRKILLLEAGQIQTASSTRDTYA